MTGPEHYREAESLLHAIDEWDLTDDEHQRIAATLAAEAQVHATLALAAATALNDAETGMSGVDHHDWLDAVSKRTQQDAGRTA